MEEWIYFSSLIFSPGERLQNGSIRKAESAVAQQYRDENVDLSRSATEDQFRCGTRLQLVSNDDVHWAMAADMYVEYADNWKQGQDLPSLHAEVCRSSIKDLHWFCQL